MAKLKKKEYYVRQAWDRLDKVESSLVNLAYLENDTSYEKYLRKMNKEIDNMRFSLQSMYKRIVTFY
jgi:hypothetical protein